jgi:hypothetical protein
LKRIAEIICGRSSGAEKSPLQGAPRKRWREPVP